MNNGEINMGIMDIQELKIRLRADAVGIRNGIIVQENAGVPMKDDPVDRISNSINSIVSPFSVAGWVRSGITEYLRSIGISSCHPYITEKTTAPSNDKKHMIVNDLNLGYHGKGTCLSETGESCIVHDLFGSFKNNPRKFRFGVLKLSPVRSKWRNMNDGVTGLGNFRRIVTHARSFDGGPFLHTENDVICNVDAIQYITLYRKRIDKEKIPIYTVLFKRAFEYLNSNRDDFDHQLGGHRTNGFGVMECDFINPFYSRKESVKYHGQLVSKREGEKKKEDDNEDNEKKKEDDKEMKLKDDEWNICLQEAEKEFDEKVKEWKEKFSFDQVESWNSTKGIISRISRKMK